jgi:ubiquinone biosynthesis protein
VRHLTRSARRLVHIVRVLAVHGAAWSVAARRRRRRGTPDDGPERLRRLFEALGGTFIKFGQMLALQPDILPLAYCNALFKLLDRVDPFPWDDADRILREELGAGADELFDEIDRRPLATASVGQVHVARVGGRRVAVKVQRPDVEIEFAHDIRLMCGAMAVIRGLNLGFAEWLLAPMGEFVTWSREELDYRFEARYGEALRRQAAGNPHQHVPRVLARFTTRRTLVVEYVEGVTLLDYLRAREAGDEELPRRLAARGFDRRRFAANVVDNFLGDAFRFGVYHADLHPANLLILDGNVVGYVDFGITGVMSRFSRRHLLAMSLSLARGDVEGMYREYLTITSHDETSDFAAFRAGLERLAATWYETGPQGPRLKQKVTVIFNEILTLSRRCRVMPERDIVKYIRSSIAIDGLMTRFEPTFDVGGHIAEVGAGHLRREMRVAWASPDDLIESWGAALRLASGGPGRLGRWSEARSGELPRRRPADGRQALRRRSLLAAASALGAVLLMPAAAAPAAPTPDLWAAELVFAAAAATVAAAGAWRLSRSGR